MIKGWSYFGVRNPRHVANDLDDMIEHGANSVLFTCSEEDMAFYADTMEKMVRLAKKRNMTVYMNPWKLGGVFGGEAFSGFLMKHPESMQIDSSGKPVPAACLNNELFRKFMTQWIEVVANCGADIAMWDEPHFFIFKWEAEWANIKDRWVCRCEACKALFRQQFNHELPAEKTPETSQFKENSIIKFLDDFSQLAKTKGLQNSVCVLPPNFGLDDGIQNIEKIFQLKAVDIVATDPYWTDSIGADKVKQNYSDNSRLLLQLGTKYNKQAEMWIKNFKIAKEQENKIELANQITYDTGVRRILAWSYLGSDYMSSLRSANPIKVYKTQSAWFKKMH